MGLGLLIQNQSREAKTDSDRMGTGKSQGLGFFLYSYFPLDLPSLSFVPALCLAV